MDLRYYLDNFKINLPIGDGKGTFWNGRPDEFSNLKYGLDYSQQFGLTPYAKTGVYGRNPDGSPKPHNGHDFAGAKGTPLVAPFRCWVSFVGWDEKGYGNYLFIETDTVQVNGEQIKMEFVIAHCDSISAKASRWYNPGETLALMGSTGMSTGPHTHFAGRPLIKKGNTFEWLIQENRGYIDLTDFFITKPIYDKQVLINQLKDTMKLVKKKGGSDIYAVDKAGNANLLINWDTYQRGILMGMWEDNVQEVDVLPKQSNIIVLTSNN